MTQIRTPSNDHRVPTSPILDPSDDDFPGNYLGLARVEGWMRARGQEPFAWQRQAWRAYCDGLDGLILAGTGMGKTKAAWLGPLGQWWDRPLPESCWTRGVRRRSAPPLLALWITPMRALAADTCQALQECIDGLSLPWTLEERTGDTSSSRKTRQRHSPPTAMVITPESLTLLLSYPESRETFAHLRCVIVDEWHELMGTKRGIQTELALARLRELSPDHQRWGLSATLGNPDFALASLVGTDATRASTILRCSSSRSFDFRLLAPASIERFPWAGHLGLAMLPQVIECIDQARTTLVFANTRNQTELWYQSILKVRPDWAGRIAVHHGSLSTEIRTWVEQALRQERLIAVVCTSSLDLGVDFAPVDQVIQIGSPKGVARVLQRAGRSGHRPGEPSRMVFVPSHALELIEWEAARRAVSRSAVESRPEIAKPLDCLVQHAVTMGLSGPYTRGMLADQVRSAHAYREIADEEIAWVLEFVTTGGSLHAYPDYHRVSLESDQYQVRDARIAKRHRVAIGTIASDMSIQVKTMNGRAIGTVEESFASRLKPGDRFLLGGKLLELVILRDGTAWVRRSKGSPTAVPRWMGGRMPLSTELAAGVRELLDELANGQSESAALRGIEELIKIQQRWSHIPKLGEVLVESCVSRDGHSCMVYPFEGRSVSEGLAALFAHRITRQEGISFSIAVNDYGFMIHSDRAPCIEWDHIREWFSTSDLETDLQESLNGTEMSRRAFREIARISGLVHQGAPGQAKSARHLQASTGMVFDALRQYDPENRLLQQALDEVARDQLELGRMRAALERMLASTWVVRHLSRWTPFSFPLYVERIRDRISSESLADRVRRAQAPLERAAMKEMADPTSSGTGG
ncbi:MAG: ligase-associated DNA damage response DEXH box helicase [Planctomycetota bacterium]